MKPILEIQNITKQFKLGAKQEGYLALRDIISKSFQKKTNSDKTFFALKDVSFNVYPGQSIGIIGKNGAGKSTLLKILSKITPPTSGKVICRGRIASLLEVGTGFHPELSGRENIYMNGSILGMRKFEIDKHFDAIVNFSGVENFLDTSLKRYSSGMQLRLAFAVAAYLEPEILIIDEVLAVGDAEFQKKCLGKMNEISKSGRTVIFVSHDMNAIEQLCNKAVILKKGVVAEQGEAHQLISHYLNENKNFTFDKLSLSENVDMVEFEFNPAEVVSGGQVSFNICLDIKPDHSPVISDFCMLIYSTKGVRITIIDLRPFLKNFTRAGNKLTIKGEVENVSLVEGEYSIGLFSNIDESRKELLDITQLRVRPAISLHKDVKPYLSQYRGHLELMNNIKVT
ncbi:MAG: ABC transporter ATP-binding protein [Ginsengibacter sp.]